MNEKLKEALATFLITPNAEYGANFYSDGGQYALLKAAARGEIPGFQLVPVEPTTEMLCEFNSFALCTGPIEEGYAAMLTASREGQK